LYVNKTYNLSVTDNVFLCDSAFTGGGAIRFYHHISDGIPHGKKYAANYCIDSCNSPCAEAGIDSLYIEDFGWFFAPVKDILGRPRPLPEGSPPDMGAFEVDMCIGMNELQAASIPESSLRGGVCPVMK